MSLEIHPPPAAARSSLVCPPAHQRLSGTLALTWATCRPQPAQVVPPQTRQRTEWHIGFS
jgi:hypothetical protein